MVGSCSTPVLVEWTEKDALLYAIGVGAGLAAPERELCYTTENTGGVALRALPSFLTILTAGQKPPAVLALNADRFLHGEQSIELFRPLPPSGRGWVHTVVESVVDKGSAAIVTILSQLHGDAEDRPLIGQGRMSIFVRDAGGFNGPRGTARAYQLPDRAADVCIVYKTRPEQPLLYRLSGDRHRLHSDPEFARAQGFDRPILHGLCTYGFACRALIEGVAGGDSQRLLAMEGRFRKPVYPGAELTTQIWLASDGGVFFQTLDDAGDAVIEHGSARISV